MRYAIINDTAFELTTDADYAAASAALAEAGVADAKVYVVPYDSLEDAEAAGYDGARVCGLVKSDLARACEALAAAYHEERDAIDAYQRACVWGDDEAYMRADRRVTAATERVSECVRLLAEASRARGDSNRS